MVHNYRLSLQVKERKQISGYIHLFFCNHTLSVTKFRTLKNLSNRSSLTFYLRDRLTHARLSSEFGLLSGQCDGLFSLFCLHSVVLVVYVISLYVIVSELQYICMTPPL